MHRSLVCSIHNTLKLFSYLQSILQIIPLLPHSNYLDKALKITLECNFERKQFPLSHPSRLMHVDRLWSFKWGWEGSHPLHARPVTTESITRLGVFQALAFSGTTKTISHLGSEVYQVGESKQRNKGRCFSARFCSTDSKHLPLYSFSFSSLVCGRCILW